MCKAKFDIHHFYNVLKNSTQIYNAVNLNMKLNSRSDYLSNYLVLCDGSQIVWI